MDLTFLILLLMTAMWLMVSFMSFLYPEGTKASGQVHANGLTPDYLPPPSDDRPGLPTRDPSIVGDASGAPDEQQTQQDPPVETDGEDGRRVARFRRFS